MSYNGKGFIELFQMHEKSQKLIFNEFVEKDLDIVLYCIKEKHINDEWLKCFEWYNKRKRAINRAHSVFKTFISPFLYRSILPSMYKKLLRYGSITANLTDQFEGESFRQANLPRSDYIWASDFIEKAWEGTQNLNPAIIVIYRKKYFYKWKSGYGGYVWIKKDKSTDYRDTIEAIIKVRYY
ncbi:MAG TPA: hypothetical protein VJJ52_06095 [Candidatus Nanoarchaeia archaeon]|nr:hypothetical protein [Candidatus Nanoarchaeia archaeon]